MMRPGRRAVCATGLASVALPFWAGAGDREVTALEAVLRDALSPAGVPGATAAVAWPDGLVTGVATGWADVEAARPMRPESRMLAASIGKTIWGALALALAREGHLDLDARVVEWLGDRPWFGAVPNSGEITVRQLLTHSAGLPDHVYSEGFRTALAARIAAGGPTLGPEELVAFVLGKEPLFEAGAGWAYSDTGYILLGLLIEAATGRDVYALARERFLDPLGLSDTSPSNRPDLVGLATGYLAPEGLLGTLDRTTRVPGLLAWDPAVEWTGGGFVTTASDLARWGQALFGGRAIAGDYLPALLDGVPVGAPGVRYGLGVAIYEDTPLGPVYGHGGWIPGYVSSLRHYAEAGVTVAFQINTDRGIMDDGSDVVPRLEAALAEAAISMG